MEAIVVASNAAALSTCRRRRSRTCVAKMGERRAVWPTPTARSSEPAQTSVGQKGSTRPA